MLAKLLTNEFTAKNHFDFAEELVNYYHNHYKLYKLYKQIHGIAMDSPFGSTLSSVFFCHYAKFGLMNILLNLNL